LPVYAAVLWVFAFRQHRQPSVLVPTRFSSAIRPDIASLSHGWHGLTPSLVRCCVIRCPQRRRQPAPISAPGSARPASPLRSGWCMLSCGASVAALVQLWFDRLFLLGIASVAVCVILCFSWLSFQEKRQRRKDQQERRRQRRSHWGNE